MKKVLVALLLCLSLSCIEPPKPQPTPTAQRIENILNDTADDLELGAQVRIIVEKQQSKRKHPQIKTPEYQWAYCFQGFIFGLAFVIVIGAIHCFLDRKHDKN